MKKVKKGKERRKRDRRRNERRKERKDRYTGIERRSADGRRAKGLKEDLEDKYDYFEGTEYPGPDSEEIETP